MSILLLILKIIGILLLILLFHVIFLVIGVLFVPFVYRIKGSYHDTLDMKASIYGLGYLVGAGGTFSQEGLHTYLHILGIRKMMNSGNNEEKSADTKKQDRTEPLSCENENMPMNQGKNESVEVSDEKDTFSSEPLSKSAKLQNLYRTLINAIRNFSETISQIRSLWTNESNQRAFMKIRSMLWQFLKCIMPCRLKLTLNFSTGSPDTTAQILGILAMFPIGYQNRWNVYPDFNADKAYADADFDVKGRILGFRLLKLFLGLVLDKDCQKLYNNFKHLNG